MSFLSVGGDTALFWSLVSADLGLEVKNLHNAFLEQHLQYYRETKDLYFEMTFTAYVEQSALYPHRNVMLEQIYQSLILLSNLRPVIKVNICELVQSSLKHTV